MKLLLVIPSLGSGGAERQLVNLAILFKQKGIDVEFVVYHEIFFYKYLLDEKLIVVNTITSSNFLERVLRVRSFIRKSKSDVVISFLETADFLNCLSVIGSKQWKVITTELSSKESTFNSFRGKVFCWFRRYSDFIVCNSYNAMSLWREFNPHYSSKLTVIYNPVILPRITTDYILKKDGRLNLVIAASYQYLKNPLGLIKALALMDIKTRDRIRINWYGRIEITEGDTAAFDESMKLIIKNNLESIIFLNESIKDIANKMNEADIVALFSELEGLPNAICEAMMIGKPIIMTRVSDYRNLVDETNGFLCDANSPESIKYALEQAINLSEKSLLKLGLSSKAKAERLFSPNAIVDQWIKLT